MLSGCSFFMFAFFMFAFFIFLFLMYFFLSLFCLNLAYPYEAVDQNCAFNVGFFFLFRLFLFLLCVLLLISFILKIYRPRTSLQRSLDGNTPPPLVTILFSFFLSLSLFLSFFLSFPFSHSFFFFQNKNRRWGHPQEQLVDRAIVHLCWCCKLARLYFWSYV